MEAERDLGEGSLCLQVKVTAGQAERASHGVGVWDLDEVIGGDASSDAHDLAANLARKRLLHITLALVILPISDWHDFEVLEHVDVGVLPHCLHN